MYLDHKSKIGDIGIVTYNIEVIVPMDPGTTQYIVDSDSRNAMYALIQSAALNPGQQSNIDIQGEYERARQRAKNRAADIQKQTVVKAVHHQVGQLESIEDLLKIETEINFRGWTNPDLINKLIDSYNETKRE